MISEVNVPKKNPSPCELGLTCKKNDNNGLFFSRHFTRF